MAAGTSIRLRLTAWYVVALAITFLVSGTATYLTSRASLYNWLDQTLTRRAERLSRGLRTVRGTAELDLSSHALRAYEGISDGFMVLDGRGRVLTARGLRPELVADSEVVKLALSGRPAVTTIPGTLERRWRVASRPLYWRDRIAAVVVVAHDLEDIDAVTTRLAVLRSLLGLFSLLMAGGLGYVLAGRALAPVAQITRAAERISEEDLSQRLPVKTQDELGKLATAFNALFDRLQRAFERQRRFTADASHELRTPLSEIRLVTSQKLTHRRTPEEYEKALRVIDAAADHMTRLLTHLLALARADAGQLHLQRERLDLVELLGHVAAQAEETSGRRIVVWAAAPVPVEGDPLRLSQLFYNLVENAVKYTPPEGSIRVEVDHQGSQARVSVRDTGAGIPAEDLPHIFERFYRVDKARNRNEGGTGLGLAIVRSIAEAHGGSVRAESEPGRGTTLVVTLPAAREVEVP